MLSVDKKLVNGKETKLTHDGRLLSNARKVVTDNLEKYRKTLYTILFYKAIVCMKVVFDLIDKNKSNTRRS